MNKIIKPLIPLWAKILLIIVAYVFLVGIFSVIAHLVLRIPIATRQDDLSLSQLVVVFAFNFAGILPTIYLFRKHIDKKSFISIGLHIKHRGMDVLYGFLIAFAIMFGGTAILHLLGSINISMFMRFDFLTLVYTSLLFLLVSLSEELLCRGYILNNLLESGNKYKALIISSTIFAAFHLFNPNLSVFGITNVFLSGVLLGSAYIFTKNLWFPISLHFFWNFIQGSVLGYPVSGQPISSFSNIKLNSKSILNGGDFGFEGSVLCSIFLVISIGVVIFFNKNRPPQLIIDSH